MNHPNNDLLKQEIKKNLYGKAQIAKIIFPPGLGEIAFQEVKFILANLWLAKKFTGEIFLQKNEIQVRPIYMHAINELLWRNHCFTDVRLVLFKDTVIGKKAFEKKCQNIRWDYFLNKKMDIKIKVNSVSSTAFHETGLKSILAQIVKPHVNDILSGDDTKETTSLYVELYKDKLTISISLAGQSLYKRGYREKLSASAPLREDIAACCIQKALLFSKTFHSDYVPQTLLIPFSGTGTFAFEYIQLLYSVVPALLKRSYAIQKMPLYRETHFLSFIKKAIEHLKPDQKTNEYPFHIICIDQSKEASMVFDQNTKNFIKLLEEIPLKCPEIKKIQDDFFKINLENLSGSLFIPLNPPYGIRLDQHANTEMLYKNIALKLNHIFMITQEKNNHVGGFILCPTEQTWSVFLDHLKQAKTETYHITQGGLDIRVCQFYVH